MNFSALEHIVSGPVVNNFDGPTSVLLLLGFFFLSMGFMHMELGAMLVLGLAALIFMGLVGLSGTGNVLLIIFVVVAVLGVIAFKVWE